MEPDFSVIIFYTSYCNTPFLLGQYKEIPDYQFASTKMIKDFNRGNLGLVNFDREEFLPSSVTEVPSTKPSWR